MPNSRDNNKYQRKLQKQKRMCAVNTNPELSRSIYILLQKLLTSITIKGRIIDCLCFHVALLKNIGSISPKEGIILLNYIRNNEPIASRRRRKLNNITLAKSYFWKIHSLPPRVKWLKKHIELNKPIN